MEDRTYIDVLYHVNKQFIETAKGLFGKLESGKMVAIKETPDSNEIVFAFIGKRTANDIKRKYWDSSYCKNSPDTGRMVKMENFLDDLGIDYIWSEACANYFMLAKLKYETHDLYDDVIKAIEEHEIILTENEDKY